MRWKILETIIHDHERSWPQEELEKIESALLREISPDSELFHAAKIAYILALIQFKFQEPREEKAMEYIQHLKTILQHQIDEAELMGEEKSQTKFLYLRKLTEHYFHHLQLIAEERGVSQVIPSLNQIRNQNHDELMKFQGHEKSFREQEQSMLRRAITQNTLVAGFFIAAATFFAWSSFWSVSDYAMANVILTDPPETKTVKIIEGIVMFIFSLGIIWIFLKNYGEEKDKK